MASPNSHARLLLVRHGQISANVERVWHGSTDSALTERGHAEAESVARLVSDSFAPEALYSSPLERTRTTAAAIARTTGLQVVPDAGLAEYAIGELEGESYVKLFQEHRFFDRIREDRDFAPPGGESLNQVVARVVGAFERIARAHPGRQVVVVGHGAAMGLGIAHVLGDAEAGFQKYHKANCALSELLFGDAPELVRFNETDHLPSG
jgi:broad specificity phosphatase PhoE